MNSAYFIVFFQEIILFTTPSQAVSTIWIVLEYAFKNVKYVHRKVCPFDT